MGYLTKYGSFWGQIPTTSGRYIWVAPAAAYTVEGQSYTASDNNDGLSPERAMRTIDAGHNLLSTAAGASDVLVILPGSHTVTAAVAADLAGAKIVGIPGSSRTPGSRGAGRTRNITQITTSETAGNIFTVSAADVEIAHLHFLQITAGTALNVTSGADRIYVHDCTFANTGAASATGETIHFSTSTTGSVDGAVIQNCYFLASGNQGPMIRALGTVLGLIIESCTFELQGTAAMDDAIEILDPGSLGILIRDCDWFTPTHATTVFTNEIDVTGVTTDAATVVYRCYFPGDAKVSIVATVTTDVSIANCYVGGSTAGRTNPQAAS